VDNRTLLKKCIDEFSKENLVNVFRRICPKYSYQEENYSHYLDKYAEKIKSLQKLGSAEDDEASRLLFFMGEIKGLYSSQTGKKMQYELAKEILKAENYDAGLFAFYDSAGNFRFSLVHALYSGKKRSFNNFRRYTYLVLKNTPNKTFLNQIGKSELSSMDKILEAFSIEAVSKDFYAGFQPKFEKIASVIRGDTALTEDARRNFALLFVIRIVFLGFIQKKGWMGGSKGFIQDLWKEYKESKDSGDSFYKEWLEPVFFTILNSPPGKKCLSDDTPFSEATKKILDSAPYLNGGIFTRNEDMDTKGRYIPDKEIEDFFEFLFQYNFTIEENSLYDEELELNPEFLGIIFEQLVNKENGAVYTPRTEVDLMCRLALAKWLEKNSPSEKNDIFHLLFREGGRGDEFDKDQKTGDFSLNQINELTKLLENITVCDPAAGSGAFEVGMLHVLNEIVEELHRKKGDSKDKLRDAAFERKKNMIANSLYGVEVKEWAVWINHLRLWLTLFIDMPDEFKTSEKPLLPSLNFKIRCGDSLVQKLGTKPFPVHGHAELSQTLKLKITELKKIKLDYFNNSGVKQKIIKQMEKALFKLIMDEEISRLKSTLAGNIFNEDTQLSMFADGIDEYSEKQLSISDAYKKKIETQIAEIETQKKSLSAEHPMIWNIEFPGIFFDNGGFDIIIGNPPYVRQEKIEDPTGKLSASEYKKELQDMVRLDFPKHFPPKKKINAQSDLYTFFYIRSLHLLNPNGIHCFICSNSWLDVGYGAWLQEFMLKNVPMHYIIDNHSRRSFASADVNTIISVVGAPQSRLNMKDYTVKFVAFKRPFDEAIFTENLLEIEEAEDIVSNDIFRVYPISNRKLFDEGAEYEDETQKTLGAADYVGDKWGGKYLRAPDIFFTILKKGKDKLVKLGDIAEVRRGFTTGCNEFFYVEDVTDLIED